MLWCISQGLSPVWERSPSPQNRTILNLRGKSSADRSCWINSSTFVLVVLWMRMCPAVMGPDIWILGPGLGVLFGWTVELYSCWRKCTTWGDFEITNLQPFPVCFFCFVFEIKKKNWTCCSGCHACTLSSLPATVDPYPSETISPNKLFPL